MDVHNYTSSALTPHHFSEEEIENPHLVFYRLFDYAHLPQIRSFLWLWLRTTITDSYRKKSSEHREKDRIVDLYERIQKLVEAAYLIYEGQKENLRKLAWQLHEQEEIAGEPQFVSTISTAEQNNNASGANKEAWNRIEAFFDIYEESGAIERLWEITTRILTDADTGINTKGRSDMVFLYDNLKVMLEAVYTLLQQRKQSVDHPQ